MMSIRSYRKPVHALVAALVGGACSKPPEQGAPPVPVQVAPVTQIAAPLTIAANGVVEPLQTVAIEAQVGGALETVTFNEGQDVQAEKDYVTKSQADQAQTAAAATLASVQADKAAVDNARLNLNYTTIRAPISGRTGRLLVRRGNIVKQNSEPLVVINQLRPILVRFPVPQHDFSALQRRNARGPVPVRVMMADSGRVGEAGTLAFLDNAVDSLTGTVTAKARFENRANELWPGEYVRVSVELDVEPNAIAVPTRAVLAGQQGSYVFVVGSDKLAKVRQISVGRAVGELTTIDKGLTPGEQVVVDGQSRLTPDAHVDVKSSVGGGPSGRAATTQAGAAR